MCKKTVPCACTLDRRAKLSAEHQQRSEALEALAFRLHGQITEAESMLLYEKAVEEWDDAIHIASADDPLRSLCGQFGRNLADLPERPDGWSGCWMCLMKADEISPRELVRAGGSVEDSPR